MLPKNEENHQDSFDLQVDLLFCNQSAEQIAKQQDVQGEPDVEKYFHDIILDLIIRKSLCGSARWRPGRHRIAYILILIDLLGTVIIVNILFCKDLRNIELIDIIIVLRWKRAHGRSEVCACEDGMEERRFVPESSVVVE